MTAWNFRPIATALWRNRTGAMLVAVQIASGDPAGMITSALATGGLVLARAEGRGGRGGRWRGLAVVAGAFVGALALAAVARHGVNPK